MPAEIKLPYPTQVVSVKLLGCSSYASFEGLLSCVVEQNDRIPRDFTQAGRMESVQSADVRALSESHMTSCTSAEIFRQAILILSNIDSFSIVGKE